MMLLGFGIAEIVGAFCAFRSARWRPRQARLTSRLRTSSANPTASWLAYSATDIASPSPLFRTQAGGVATNLGLLQQNRHFSDLAGRTDDVCSLRQTGSKRRALTIALLTLNGHRSRADCESISQIARASPTPTETTRFERRTAAAASPHFCWPTYFCV